MRVKAGAIRTLSQQRRAVGLSREEVAARLGISVAQLDHIERARLDTLPAAEAELQTQLWSEVLARQKALRRGKVVETCCVVDEFCLSPANLEPPVPARGHCFACGQAVCSHCSLVVDYHSYGRVRLCHNCLREYDGDNTRVVNHLRRLAEE